MSFSPSDIEVMIHYHTDPNPHPREDAPAVKDAMKMFIQLGFLHWQEGQLRSTDLGAAWITMLCHTPLPLIAFVTPNGEVINERLGTIKGKT